MTEQNRESNTAGSNSKGWVLVTGSTSGIGCQTATALARTGYSVIVHGRDAHRAAEVVDEIRRLGGRAEHLLADLADPTAGWDLAARSLEVADGIIDVLINNAGGGAPSPTDEVTNDQFDWSFNVHVRALIALVATLVPPMAERGHSVVINVSGIASVMASAGYSLFQSSKTALAKRLFLVEGIQGNPPQEVQILWAWRERTRQASSAKVTSNVQQTVFNPPMLSINAVNLY
ncbi:SDR family oxidoreductase [Nostoc sp. ChiQUE01b]|uniref:SDR family NAD(P)-dependent oxidoreductase n=1 Tax=Nostoc sp. ChiQUE01b TaxID=3075376 RepID=UPI002AD5034B|nr:SDR family oxidoreductase [Nostoc sp. ChiQUE01b]MDZ8264661.1 SDR family oxidoreductase [Nostoc sp. ChiQUE01b]